MKVLYVEDDRVAREFVEKGLGQRGFRVELATTVAEGLERARPGDWDALIVDVMLPDGEGFALVERLREEGHDGPILFLSARGEVADRVQGLETGADDYLAKPFALAELVARLRAITRRRGGGSSEPRLEIADLVLDAEAGKVWRAGRAIDLPPKQFSLLELLMRRAGRVVRRSAIVEEVWGYGAELRSNAVDVQINYLRNRIDRDFEPKLVHTKPGVGYVLEDRSG